MRRFLAFVVLGLVLTSGAFAPVQAQYPTKPVRIIVPFPPGGPVDGVARQVAQRLAEATGQNFLVENRAGGNSAIGSDAVAKSAPDGYTLLINASIFAINPHLVKVPYDIQKDFTPVALLAKGPLVITVTPGLEAKDVAALIAYGRANPGKLAFAIGSNGSAGHLSTELFKRQAGLDLLIVPYKGSTPAYADLMSGQIQGFIEPVLGALPLIKSGRIRALAVTSSKPLGALPGVRTVAETGLPGFEFYVWYGLWGPAGLPKDALDRLNAEANRVLASPAMRERFEQQGFETQTGSPEAFAKFVRDDSALSARIIREVGIKAE
ncbi:MAG TPA: tripartite tricarboxylate transporter substrate binding protein [Burkholderiales bacterium]|nr:tripartite tricarboxylate transporter substrate binding protein [Burkholderiales bacterium]